MSRGLSDKLVPFEAGDRPDLDVLEDRFSRGSRIMVKALLVWVLFAAAAIGVAAAFTAFAGEVAAVIGAIFLFMVLIHVVTRRRLGKLRADVRGGQKLCIEGVIARKEVAGQGGTRASAPQYFLHLEGERFWVDAQTHSAVEEGANVRLEYLPASELVLRIQKL